MVVLALPVAIFTFLRFFGDNKFDVPVMYEQWAQVGSCGTITYPFTVADSLAPGQGIEIVIVPQRAALTNVLVRLQDVFGKRVDYHESAPGNEHVRTCGFLLEGDRQLVLLDEQNRVRGQYGADLDEVDRLIVETKILLENNAREKAE